MADEFKKEMHGRCGIGGIKCWCCNDYHGKERKVLKRLVRRSMKQKMKKNIDNEI